MSDHAVYLRDACKRYGCGKKVTQVLSDLNMNVNTGSIYGLLGASGCGKTTLLNCIIGRQVLNSGQINVLGAPPGTKGNGVPGSRVGYMPQRAALVNEFTVKNTVFYFGWLFNMKTEILKNRYEFLSLLLELPVDNAKISNLSGGQQRRVSLAAALVHNPELLILDEPTVGLDPVLRKSIWDYLQNITADRKVTVIVTTHYIEEAMQAHTVGLMRFGKLLAEDSPQNLLQQFSSPTLEGVFLSLSTQQGESMNTQSVNGFQTSNVKRLSFPKSKEVQGSSAAKDVLSSQSHLKDKDSLLSRNHMKALVFKSFIHVIRNPGGVAFVALFPIIQVSLFFLAIGHYPTGLILAVVNEELGEFTTCSKYLDMKNDSLVIDNITLPCELPVLSCVYLDFIKDSIATKVYFPNKESGLSEVRAGRAIGLLYFPQNFTGQLDLRQTLNQHASAKTLTASEIQIYMDMSELQSAMLVKTELYEQFHNLAELLALKCDMDLQGSASPFRYHEPVYGTTNPRYDSFMTPGVLTSTVFFLATSITATLIVTERTEGIWDRDLVAGTSALEILLSYFFSQIAFVVLQILEVVFTTLVLFGLECHGHILNLMAIMLFIGFSGMMFGLLISVLSSSFTMAIFITLGSYIPFLNLTGMLWPIEGMPTALRWFSLAMPITLPTLAVGNVMHRGWNLLHPHVYQGILTCCAWMFGQLGLAVLVLKIKDDNILV